MDDDLVELECSILRKAIRQFARDRYVSLVRKALFRLQRVPALGLFEYEHKTIWDEYCHDRQEGPHEFLRDALEAEFRPIIREIVVSLKREDAVVLICDTVDDVTTIAPRFGADIAVDNDALCERLAADLSLQAMARDMSRFDPG